MKMPIQAPFWDFWAFGVWTPKWGLGVISTKPPKDALRGKTSYDVQIMKIGPLVRPLCVTMIPKTTKKPYSGKLHSSRRPPTSSDRNQSLH